MKNPNPAGCHLVHEEGKLGKQFPVEQLYYYYYYY